MTCLLLRTGFHPVLDVDGVAGVGKPTTANRIKDRTQLPNITVNRLSGKMHRAAAFKPAKKAEMRAVEDVNLSSTTLITMMQETDDVSWSGVEK